MEYPRSDGPIIGTDDGLALAKLLRSAAGQQRARAEEQYQQEELCNKEFFKASDRRGDLQFFGNFWQQISIELGIGRPAAQCRDLQRQEYEAFKLSRQHHQLGMNFSTKAGQLDRTARGLLWSQLAYVPFVE